MARRSKKRDDAPTSADPSVEAEGDVADTEGEAQDEQPADGEGAPVAEQQPPATEPPPPPAPPSDPPSEGHPAGFSITEGWHGSDDAVHGDPEGDAVHTKG